MKWNRSLDFSFRRRRWIPVQLLAVVLMVAGSWGCMNGNGKFPQLGISELRIGVTPDFPPLIFQKDGKYEGVEAEFAEMLGPELGIPIKFMPMPWLDLIPALEDGKINIIMSAMTVTPERSQRVLFTHPYFAVSQMALFRTRDIARFPDAAAILKSNARIGVVAETTGDYFVREHCPRARRIPFSSFQLAKDELLKGRVDAVISDASTVSHVTDPKLVGMYEPLNQENLAWAVSRNNPELLQVLNTILAKWKEDGTLEKVRDRWLSGLIKTRIY